jgi:hypothetical protein
MAQLNLPLRFNRGGGDHVFVFLPLRMVDSAMGKLHVAGRQSRPPQKRRWTPHTHPNPLCVYWKGFEVIRAQNSLLLYRRISSPRTIQVPEERRDALVPPSHFNLSKSLCIFCLPEWSSPEFRQMPPFRSPPRPWSGPAAPPCLVEHPHRRNRAGELPVKRINSFPVNGVRRNPWSCARLRQPSTLPSI